MMLIFLLAATGTSFLPGAPARRFTVPRRTPRAAAPSEVVSALPTMEVAEAVTVSFDTTQLTTLGWVVVAGALGYSVYMLNLKLDNVDEEVRLIDEEVKTLSTKVDGYAMGAGTILAVLVFVWKLLGPILSAAEYLKQSIATASLTTMTDFVTDVVSHTSSSL